MDRRDFPIDRAEAALDNWDKACESLLGEFDAGDELAEILRSIVDYVKENG